MAVARCLAVGGVGGSNGALSLSDLGTDGHGYLLSGRNLRPARERPSVRAMPLQPALPRLGDALAGAQHLGGPASEPAELRNRNAQACQLGTERAVEDQSLGFFRQSEPGNPHRRVAMSHDPLSVGTQQPKLMFLD